jgi:class 3 adenylate cyclase/tetratricopeptide (TPR) repeat protein
MKCPRCQHENEAGAKFCEECAAPLARACAACGRPLSPTAKFCPECAHPTGPAAPPSPGQRFGSPQSYTPRHLAERILTSKTALEGERKQVTVLFADLKGSMELLADRDPEEARRILDPVLEHMMEAVHRYEGTVNQVMGDGIMALFGAPLAHEDHAVRACYAALRMQDSVKPYAEDVHRKEGAPIQIRVGLNSGDVVVRSIGSDLRMDYTAVGQTTHLAARMEQLAMPGSILITPATLALAEGYLVVKSLGPRPIRGLPGPLEVYEIVGAATVRSRFQAAASRGLTRFIGRQTELDQLHQALDQAGAGRGQVVAVVGEPGIGKSRLYWEFTRSHRTQGWLTIEAGSVSYGKATNYLPVVELLRAYFPIEAGDGARKITEKVTGKLLALDRTLEAVISPLLWLLDVPVDDESWARLDSGQRRRQTLDGVKRLLLRESQAQPLVVVFEDLHWIDAETQALLDSLVESLPAARMLLLVNYRPEYQHTWSSKTYYRLLRIDPLAQVSSEELLDALLGTDVSLRSLKELVIARTEGNPFFLEESVRTLVETKILVGERGAYRLTTMPNGLAWALEIPASTRALLTARIDRLSPEDKRLLQAASVIGTDVPFDLLQALVGEDETDLRRGLTRLQAAEFLYETRFFPELEYTFKHALTHEVAYGSLLHERRRALHAKIVEAIEERGHVDEQVERIADHAFRGELWEKAATYCRHAGMKGLARSSNVEALAHFERALAALRHLPETGETLSRSIDLLFDQRNALQPLGEFGAILERLGTAERLARTLDDRRRIGWVSCYLAGSLWITGQLPAAHARAEDAAARASELEDVRLAVAADFYLAETYFATGDYRQAAEIFGRSARSTDDELRRDPCGITVFPSVVARAWWAVALAKTGAFDDALACGYEAVRIAEEIDQPYTLLIAFWCLGSVYGLKGEFSRAVALLERGLDRSSGSNIALIASIVSALLGYTCARAGNPGRGLALLQEALAILEQKDLGWFNALVGIQLAEVCLLAARTEEARGFAERALSFARARGERGWVAYALRVVGEIMAHGETRNAEAAESHYREAAALADELGMRLLVAHCHLGLGKLYRESGKRKASHESFARATTMYREMDMRFWLEQAEAEMKGLV